MITPLRIEAEGTLRRRFWALSSLRRSKLPKKNTRSFTIGPPIDAPYWLRFSCSLSMPARLLNQLLAANAVSRLYSYADPRKVFVPLLVTSVT
jgi:hypothetical protein